MKPFKSTENKNNNINVTKSQVAAISINSNHVIQFVEKIVPIDLDRHGFIWINQLKTFGTSITISFKTSSGRLLMQWINQSRFRWFFFWKFTGIWIFIWIRNSPWRVFFQLHSLISVFEIVLLASETVIVKDNQKRRELNDCDSIGEQQKKLS